MAIYKDEKAMVNTIIGKKKLYTDVDGTQLVKVEGKFIDLRRLT